MWWQFWGSSNKEESSSSSSKKRNEGFGVNERRYSNLRNATNEFRRKRKKKKKKKKKEPVRIIIDGPNEEEEEENHYEPLCKILRGVIRIPEISVNCRLHSQRYMDIKFQHFDIFMNRVVVQLDINGRWVEAEFHKALHFKINDQRNGIQFWTSKVSITNETCDFVRSHSTKHLLCPFRSSGYNVKLMISPAVLMRPSSSNLITKLQETFQMIRVGCVILRYKNLALTISDLEIAVNPTEQINDRIVDFSLIKLMENYNQQFHRFIDPRMPGKQKQLEILTRSDIVMMNTQFFPLLLKDIDRASKRVPNPRNCIFHSSEDKLKRYVFIPFMQVNHWMLFIIFFPYLVNRIIYYHPQRQQQEFQQFQRTKKPFILFWDSLGMTNQARKYYPLIVKYLLKRYNMEQKGSNNQNNRYKVEMSYDRMEKMFPLRICSDPIQMNNYDCGMFLMEYIKFVVNNKPSKIPFRHEISQMKMNENRVKLRDILWKVCRKAFEKEDNLSLGE